MKPALHRSVLFWLGLLVLVFLVWAWADSRKMQAAVVRTWSLGEPRDPRMAWSDGVWVDSGKLGIAWSRVTVTSSKFQLVYDPIRFDREAAKDGGGWFAEWEASSDTLDEQGRSLADMGETAGGNATVVVNVVEVPMWEIVGSYLWLCGVVLVWRWRRRKRVLLDGESKGMEGVNA